MALFATATEAFPRFLPEALGPIRNGLVPAHPAGYGPGGYPQHRGQTMSPPSGPARIGNLRKETRKRAQPLGSEPHGRASELIGRGKNRAAQQPTGVGPQLIEEGNLAAYSWIRI